MIEGNQLITGEVLGFVDAIHQTILALGIQPNSVVLTVCFLEDKAGLGPFIPYWLYRDDGSLDQEIIPKHLLEEDLVCTAPVTTNNTAVSLAYIPALGLGIAVEAIAQDRAGHIRIDIAGAVKQVHISCRVQTGSGRTHPAGAAADLQRRPIARQNAHSLGNTLGHIHSQSFPRQEHFQRCLCGVAAVQFTFYNDHPVKMGIEAVGITHHIHKDTLQRPFSRIGFRKKIFSHIAGAEIQLPARIFCRVALTVTG